MSRWLTAAQYTKLIINASNLLQWRPRRSSLRNSSENTRLTYDIAAAWRGSAGGPDESVGDIVFCSRNDVNENSIKLLIIN